MPKRLLLRQSKLKLNLHENAWNCSEVLSGHKQENQDFEFDGASLNCMKRNVNEIVSFSFWH